MSEQTPKPGYVRLMFSSKSSAMLSPYALQLTRGDSVHLPNVHYPGHPFSDPLDGICCCFILVNMVATDCEVRAERKN